MICDDAGTIFWSESIPDATVRRGGDVDLEKIAEKTVENIFLFRQKMTEPRLPRIDGSTTFAEAARMFGFKKK
jgi:hypothetical protein